MGGKYLRDVFYGKMPPFVHWGNEGLYNPVGGTLAVLQVCDCGRSVFGKGYEIEFCWEKSSEVSQRKPTVVFA